MKKETGKVKMLDKKALFKEMKLKTQVVELTTGNVLVSELSAKDYLEMMDLCSVTDESKKDENGVPEIKVDMKKFNPALVVRSVVDENGNRIFDDVDMDMIAKSSTFIFNKISLAAKKLNGLIGDEGNV